MPSDIEAKRIHDNPSPEELRAFTEEMPQTKISGFDNVNVQTRATSRSSASTFVVGEEGSSSGKVISREEFDRISAMQDAYIRDQEMVVVDGYIGNDDDFKVAARLTIEKANAN
ncbi:MAG TPA: phosphoenolpyruvate carboxykinase (ATP), partial [Actinomycetota bacterium]|nr:phosphoenolpyruvate carboxykinase (ATP) [Actinomycetota bacterium]